MSKVAAVKTKGAFMDSLVRNNKQIREDRAEGILEDAQMAYKRCVEDLQRDITRARRERENMLDLSATDKNSLMLGKDFDSGEYIKQDGKLGLDIRNLEIKLEIATERYTHLFGELT